MPRIPVGEYVDYARQMQADYDLMSILPMIGCLST